MPLDPILYDPAAESTLEDFLAWALRRVMDMNGPPIRSQYRRDDGLYWQHRRQWEQAQAALKAYDQKVGE